MGHVRLPLVAALLAGLACLRTADQPIVGLITKTDTNPFFVKMKESAENAAAARGARLLTGAGKTDGDNAGQVTHLENMVAAGADAILITPCDSKAIVPSIRKARDAGVLVIALDSPADPEDATDALFATDNYKAGLLIGRYARAALAGRPARIATLDLLPGHPVGARRHNGFLAGFGLKSFGAESNALASPPEVVCMQDTYGNQARGQTAMENCLQRDPEINLVYTINEPSAAGAHQALRAAGRERDVMIVSVDGGCAGVRNVKAGVIAATAQQYPLRMAELGVEAAVEFARSGKRPTKHVDTGVTLITDHALPGVESKDTAFGLSACWGQ